MSINYMQELHDAINSSNDRLIKAEIELEQAKSASKLSLNYARESLKKHKANFKKANRVNDKSLSLEVSLTEGVSLANNALMASQQSFAETSKATAIISTTASSIQIAANTIVKLSSDVASMLAVASAADDGSKIQESLKSTNVKITQADKLAEELNLISLQVTIEAAQSTVQSVVTNAEQTLTVLTELQIAASTQSDNAIKQVKAAQTAFISAINIAKSASVTYDLAFCNYQASKTTRELIDQSSNRNFLRIDQANDSDQLAESSPARTSKSPGNLEVQKAKIINNLIKLVESAKLSCVKAEASYQFFVADAELQHSFLKSATDQLAAMTHQRSLIDHASQNVDSLTKVTAIASQTADHTYANVLKLLSLTEEVVNAVIDAASEIVLSAELIMKRKASNPLISSELVSDASQAAAEANHTVSLFIAVLTSTYSALSATNQANKALEIVKAEVGHLKTYMFKSEILNDREKRMPISSLIISYIKEAIDTQNAAQKAFDSANDSVNKAKDNLAFATTQLSTAEASLMAAEAAVG
uniref:hypothetical protein n=1 Tax=Roseivirga sp. TaxID=1964215 RepID=UPI00404721A1